MLVEQAQDEHWVQVEEERARLLAMLEDALSISQLISFLHHMLKSAYLEESGVRGERVQCVVVAEV